MLQVMCTRCQDRNTGGDKKTSHSNGETHSISVLDFSFCPFPPKPPTPTSHSLFLLHHTHILFRLRSEAIWFHHAPSCPIQPRDCRSICPPHSTAGYLLKSCKPRPKAWTIQPPSTTLPLSITGPQCDFNMLPPHFVLLLSSLQEK